MKDGLMVVFFSVMGYAMYYTIRYVVRNKKD